MKTICFLPMPAFGHLNPLCGVIKEICTMNSFKVICYGSEMVKELIEKTGAEYREYESETIEKFKRNDSSKELMSNMVTMTSVMIDFTNDIVPRLFRELKIDQPDLIVYDNTNSGVKIVIKLLAKEKSIKQPRTMSYLPCFAMDEQLANEQFGNEKVSPGFGFLVKMFYYFLKQVVFNIRYGIWLWHPLAVMRENNKHLNLVTVLPELQPFRERMTEFTFVGPCIAEEVRRVEITDTRLKEYMDLFDPATRDHSNSLKLVFISLGTVFNYNLKVYETLLRALSQFDGATSKRRFKLDQLRVIFSLGDSYEAVTKKLQDKQLPSLPDNIRLFKSVPQIEVLKRASLFVTHAGQNSASETIQYAVPVVCIPIMADQPVVAKRLCDELKLGLRLAPQTLDENEFNNAIEEVLANETYKQSVLELSAVSKKYTGIKTFVRYVLDTIEMDEQNYKKTN